MAKQQAPPVRKNETVQLTFEDLTHEGNGVGKIDGYPIFVPYILPEEKADVKVVKVNKCIAYGKLLDVHQEIEHRVHPPCDVFYQCCGCQLQHMTFEMQLAI